MENSLIVSVEGKPISTLDVVVHLKEKAEFRDSLQELIKLKALESYAEKNGISISDEELQSFVNNKRKTLGILSTQATQAYLSSLGISSDQWIEALDLECLQQKVMDSLIQDDDVEKYYLSNKLQFVEVELYKIELDNIDKAEEILIEARDEKKSFYDLAREYSIDEETKPASGYIGRIKRGKLNVNIEQKVFSSDENTFFGPIKTGTTYSVFFVKRVIVPELDEELQNRIKNGLFDLWLNQLVQSVRIELPNN